MESIGEWKEVGKVVFGFVNNLVGTVQNGYTERAKIEHGYYGGELPAGYMLGNPNNNNSGGFGNIATIGMAFCGFLFLVVLLVLFKK